MKTERRTAYAALRRGITFLCTLVLSLMAVTLPAEAVNVDGSLNDSNIRLSYEEYAGTQPSLKRIDSSKTQPRQCDWHAADTEITGTVTPAEYYGKSGAASRYQCEGNASSALTITNMSGEASLLRFSYTLVSKGGKLTFGHNGETTEGDPSGGTYSAILGLNEFVTVTLTTPEKTETHRGSNQSQYITEATLRDIELISMNTNISVKFETAEGGTYYAATADGGKLPMGDTYSRPRNTVYTFTAEPSPDYNFVGWYVDGQKLSPVSPFTTSFNESCTVEAKFVSKDAALFETGGQYFVDLNEAVAYAQANSKDKITLASDGKITGTYTIPSGVTLLIPFDAAGTLYTNQPEKVKKEETPKAYRILTMAPSSSITVDGAISVGGKHYAASSGSCCKATGPYGQIIMQEGSRITLNNHANLYAWGYITGDGQITANSGATVYEYFQVADWRGGLATSNMILPPNKQQVFPFSQYYVQNIEAPLTIQNGATEKAYFSVDAAIVGTNSVTIDFIGSNTSLFRINEGGELTKKYDPKTDRITYTTKGSASLDSLALSVPGYNIDSKNYVLPVNSNMTLEILSGKVAVNCDAALLPGARITIARGAELSVSTNTSLYVYDKDQWNGPYVYASKENGFVPVPYTPTPKGSRTLANAKIDVNGTLTAAGSIYTTNSGANICSSEGTGKFVQQSVPGTAAVTHQVSKQENTKDFFGVSHVKITYADIPITPAKLKNADGVNDPYTLTAGSKVGDTFTYCTGSECGGGTWVPNLQVAAIIGSTGTQTPYPTLQDAVGAYEPDDNTAPKNYIKLLHSTTEEIDAQSDLYLDLNGCTVTGNFTMNSKTLYGMDSSAGTGYVTAPRGKIVGGVSYYAKTYQTPPTENKEYDRYVAILGAENGTPTLSFHRFNISVTGYRFELTSGDTPKCALFFIGKFRGDDAAKKHLKSLGFTLTGGNGTGPKEFSCEMPQALGNEVFSDKDGAFLFEVYLKRSFGKDASAASFTEGISATAKATFQNQGVLGEQLSNERTLSFKEAWEKADNLDPAQKAIIDKILREHGINQ